jgi:hypothetical protein
MLSQGTKSINVGDNDWIKWLAFWCRGFTSGVLKDIRKGFGGWISENIKYTCHVNGKMRPVEANPWIGGG